ncbi:hypothetical protein BMS3Bbin13_01523 [bacterium BMS3Bbin13]|nr:hypothetical protein BMS3Bbin13_01523 [bacterium BMS3Bbin13]
MRQVIAQPALGAAGHFHVVSLQPGLLAQFAKQRLLGSLVRADPTLGKLPSILPDAPCPEQPPAPVGYDDPDVRTISIAINHL